MVEVKRVDWDQVAGEYAVHRRIHAGVFRELCRHSTRGPDWVVLEVGCGSGNYLGAMAGHFGGVACGLDPSAGMLDHARARPERIGWVLGRAEQLPFADNTCDLIFSVDVIHHVADKAAFYHEAARTLRAGGRLCTVTDSEEIIRRREILSGYFPETVEIELARYPRMAQLEAWMAEAGLAELEMVMVEEPYVLLSSQPFRDRAFSSLHLIGEEAWQAGLERLERDLAQGVVRAMSRYACLWGRKERGTGGKKQEAGDRR